MSPFMAGAIKKKYMEMVLQVVGSPPYPVGKVAQRTYTIKFYSVQIFNELFHQNCRISQLNPTPRYGASLTCPPAT